jgi:hypothetical protein
MRAPVVKRCWVFERRAELYRQVDSQLRSRTRFFAAAALINTVLAQLFCYIPDRALGNAYGLLCEAGAALEAANLKWVTVLGDHTRVRSELDQILVRGEQRLLQSFLDTAQSTHRWSTIPISEDLNRLMNHRHWALLGAPCLGHSRRFLRILESVRASLGHCFDFTMEAHRVELGLEIVCDVRRRELRPLHSK